MLGITHTAIALTGAVCITGSVDLSVLLLAGMGSQIPDLDTTKSWIGKALYPLAKFLEERFPHRSATHSIFLSLAIALITLPTLWLYGWQLWIAAPLGHLLSCFSDCSTKLGCQFFYPINKDNWVIGLNPRNRIETGKTADYAILATTVCIGAIAFYLITGGGGIGAWATRTLFPTERTAIELLQQEDQKAIAVFVEGTRRVDGTKVSQKFWAIGASGGTLISRSSEGQILRIGQGGEVVPKRVNTLPERLAMKIRRQRIEEAEAREWINSLSPGALIVGNLEIEDAAEISLPIPAPGVMPVVSKSGIGISLDHASPSDLTSIEEFFIVSGEVLIKEL
ncbi:membrane-bound metal-dependent hydrolase [Tolypothrix sp. NIES-4075]|uniref:metal-dependent hydrolase n=1 Tax=Tolypothrix sp. NIES-4075 TaxID=2005459 RepID=UPI000B5C687E|nr:metal-dependent hydrolase [Tolypothrix sp. NIES-4075]GAX45786.1 membrane-bound metal-dependent hydrolase [Tolypothrix sp. NIES-4075]